MDAVARALEGQIDERQVRPIACEDVRLAREEYIREHYQHVVAPTSNPRSIRVLDSAATSQDRQTQFLEDGKKLII